MPNAKPNEIDIAGLRELEAKATKGPWDAFMVDGNVCYTSISAHGLTILRVETEPGWPECERSFAGFSEIDDASFIAALRNSALDLLALAEIGQAAVDELEKEYGYDMLGSNQAMILRKQLSRSYLARKYG